ncbi:MAG: nitrous oxide reductase family maturation protein NosD [Myxococcales bacterium]|nr:nitrous oxide reductase family maturation protein NosD [Myxococcales bacterium]
MNHPSAKIALSTRNAGLKVSVGLATLMAVLLVGQTAVARTLVVGQGGRGLAATVNLAADGDRVEVPTGVWTGQVVVDKAITLIGTGGVIDGQGKGITILVKAPGAVVSDLIVRNSGETLSGLPPDACIHVAETAKGAVIRGCKLSKCAFGIWVHKTRNAHLDGNTVTGLETGHRSYRGNGIHLFDASHLVVKGNTVTGGRDGIYVSATEDSLIEGNVLKRTRYGVHYMFSYRNTLRKNRSIGSGSGYAIMSSQHLKVTENVAEENEHHGILFRDVQYSHIANNHMRGNGEGLFFYSSTENVIKGNNVIGNGVGAKIWAGSVRNTVTENRFVGNRRQVFYVSTKDLVWAKTGKGNRWGDYLGWDTDGDGVGERPYRVDSFTASLVHRFPAAVLLLRSPTLELLGHLERRMPLLRTATVIDERPLVAARTEKSAGGLR